MSKSSPKLTLTLCITLILTLTIPGAAHVVKDTPWHPAAAAYRRVLFYLDLKPTNWSLIASEYELPIKDSGYNGSVLALLEASGNPNTTALEQAIHSQDHQGLYEASTRALSYEIRRHLQQAEEKLVNPGSALASVLEAQRLYRAFEQDYLVLFDPEGYEQLGRDWLLLANSVGSSGLGGAGSVAADREAFHAARVRVEAYLVTNYEPSSFSQRERFAPAPEEPFLAGARHYPAVLPPGSDLNDQDPLPLLRLNFEAQGHDEADLPLVAFGDMLFDSPEIFGEPARSLGITCSTCHNRSDINRRAFIPGISHQAGSFDVDGSFFNPIFNDQRSDSLDTPSLRGLRFTGPYGRDGRFASLRDFTRNVVVNEFAGVEPSPFVLDALVAYMLEFDFLPNAYLNADGTLTDLAPESAYRGEVLFNTTFAGLNGKSCATCHIPNAGFKDGQIHDIGTGQDGYTSGSVITTEYDGFFETPTLLNSALTFPYMHDGSLASLADVSSWFNENFSLGLSEAQVADLSSYLETIGTADKGFEVFDSENTPFSLPWAELTTFTTTLDTMLIPRQDKDHALLLLNTVVPDFRADASGLQDLSQAPLVYEVADLLDSVKEAILNDDWTEAAQRYQDYESLVEAYGPGLK